jgi:type II secretory pathway predicted ATPase ExeA
VEHLHHYGLSRDPFANDPRPLVHFESADLGAAERRVRAGLAQRKGLIAVLGASGTGKTLLLRRLLEGLEEEVFDASLLVPTPGIVDTRWILTRFARHLEVEEPAREPAELLGQVYERLAIVREDGRHAVLLLDEGQGLAAGPTLRELRGLLNLEYEDHPLLSLVVAGLPELGAAIAADDSLAGRLELRVRLHGLGQEEVPRYVAERLEAAGAAPGVFSEAALRELGQRSQGRHRLLHAIADGALWEGFEAGCETIGPAEVARAARDLLELAADPEAPEPVEASCEPPLPERGRAAASRPASHPAGAPAAEAAVTRLFPDRGARGGRGFGDYGRPAEEPPKEDEIDDLFVELVEE